VGPRGGVVTQRSAKPFTPVQFWSWPPNKINYLNRNRVRSVGPMGPSGDPVSRLAKETILGTAVQGSRSSYEKTREGRSLSLSDLGCVFGDFCVPCPLRDHRRQADPRSRSLCARDLGFIKATRARLVRAVSTEQNGATAMSVCPPEDSQSLGDTGSSCRVSSCPGEIGNPFDARPTQLVRKSRQRRCLGLPDPWSARMSPSAYFPQSRIGAFD
jgi:hypothetical protein